MADADEKARRKICQFCVDKVDSIDYKDLMKIRKYLSEKGKILPRRISDVAQSISVS